jgi:hypothetical protein
VYNFVESCKFACLRVGSVPVKACASAPQHYVLATFSLLGYKSSTSIFNSGSIFTRSWILYLWTYFYQSFNSLDIWSDGILDVWGLRDFAEYLGGISHIHLVRLWCSCVNIVVQEEVGNVTYAWEQLSANYTPRFTNKVTSTSIICGAHLNCNFRWILNPLRVPN